MTKVRRDIAWTVLLAAGAALAACGQRGDLYLPTPQKSPVPAAGADCSRPAGSDAGTPAPGCTRD